MINNLPIPVIVNLLAMINPFIYFLKEKHFVKRSTAITNSVGLIITGIAILIFHPSLYVFKLPLASFPLIIGIIGILMTSKKINGWDIIGRSITSLIILILIFLVQFGILIV